MIEAGIPIHIHCNNPDLLELPPGFPAIIKPNLEFEKLPEACSHAHIALGIHPATQGGLSPWSATAMINGAALVCDRHTWMAKEFPDGRRAMHFPGTAPEKAVNATIRLLRRERRCAAIAAAARNHMLERYTPEHLAAHIILTARDALPRSGE